MFRRVTVVLGVFIGFLFSVHYANADDLFVSDMGSGCIYRIAPNGTKSTFASGLNLPSGLAFDGNGNLFVADSRAGNIYEFTPSGSQSTFASGLNFPRSLAFDRNGNLFVSAVWASEIYEFTPGGSRTTVVSVGSAPYGPESLAFDQNGNLFFDNGTEDADPIREMTPSGSLSTFATLFTGTSGANAMAFDHSGNLFVSDNCIYEFTPGGSQSIFTTEVNGPEGLAFDESGNLFEADINSGNIYEFSPNGTQSTFASGLIHPVGLAFAPNPVPEPSTLFLLGIGAISLLGFAWRRRRGRARCLSCAAVVVAMLIAGSARADVFNMGGTYNQATGTWTGAASLQFVTVGNPGNAADPSTGYGSVGYTYQMGKYHNTLS
jgi:sugar lactone lactonase YvrE